MRPPIRKSMSAWATPVVLNPSEVVKIRQTSAMGALTNPSVTCESAPESAARTGRFAKIRTQNTAPNRLNRKRGKLMKTSKLELCAGAHYYPLDPVDTAMTLGLGFMLKARPY